MRKIRRLKNIEATYRIYLDKIINSMMEEVLAKMAESDKE
jgi:hypothetical protein